MSRDCGHLISKAEMTLPTQNLMGSSSAVSCDFDMGDHYSFPVSYQQSATVSLSHDRDLFFTLPNFFFFIQIKKNPQYFPCQSRVQGGEHEQDNDVKIKKSYLI